jgi:tetratricopeptide (TPR) repeat protein
MTRRILAVSLFALLALAQVAQASWYDDYDDGLAAVKRGDWNTVVQKMTAAIKGKPTEGNRVKTYGTIMINYHPYYYRGVAYLNTGRYEQAIADFEQTSGPGPENLGSLDTLMERAKKQLASSSAAPEPAPVQTPPPAATRPAPAQPAGPQIDPALRQRATSTLSSAKQKIQSAQQRRATTSPQYAQAMSMFTDATTRNASARSNEDLSSIIALAQNAGDLADLAMPPSAPSAASTSPAPSITPIVPKPAAATTSVMQENDYSADVRRALEYYFAGEFEESTRRFEDLVRKMPNNAWIWAFLGASQYSQYAFEAEDRFRSDALRSFKRAKQLRPWSRGLPKEYFSKRIRKVFDETAG